MVRPLGARSIRAVDAVTVGTELRRWRRQRRVSQLELALLAGTTQRHVSYIEQGRSQPGRGMVLRLAEALDLPLRDRNALLHVAGHAAQYSESAFDGGELQAVRETLLRVLDGHLPAPAVLAARDGRLVAANAAFDVLSDGVAPYLLAPPVNVLRFALHPDGMAPRIANLAVWGRHVIAGLRAEGHAGRLSLIDELETYLPPAPPRSDHGGFAVPLKLMCPEGMLELVTTVTRFATTVDVTLAELALEAFLPADERTAELLRRREEARRAR
jgi:transcriptional regulator with XRE-family HTH domain